VSLNFTEKELRMAKLLWLRNFAQIKTEEDISPYLNEKMISFEPGR
jgi:hypothetical protein